jgi:CheY-like chemotaxis protein
MQSRISHKSPSPSSPHATSPLRVLLAEDNVVNQIIALHLLEHLGYQADLVSNGLEVLTALHHQRYDVVLMDMYMPEMDGTTAAQHICREWRIDRRPRIIAITANTEASDRLECQQAGMDGFLVKPICKKQLAEALDGCQRC